MFGRCRNCESHQIRVTFPDTKSKSPDTHKLQPSLDEAHGLELKKLIDRKSYKDQIVQAIANEMEAEYNPVTDQLEDPMSKPNWTPHWFLSLYAWHKVEQGEDFKSSFYRHATRKGYFFHSLSNLTAAGTESVHAEVTDHVTENKNFLKLHRDGLKKERDTSFKILRTMSETELRERTRELTEKKVGLNPGEKMELDICFTLTKVKPECRETLTIEDVSFIKNNSTAIQLAQIIHVGERPNLDDRIVDLKRICKSNLPEEYEMLGQLVEDLHTLLKGIGFNGGLFDRATFFSKATILENVKDEKNTLVVNSISKNLNMKELSFGNSQKGFVALRKVLQRIGLTMSSRDTSKSPSKNVIRRKGKQGIVMYGIELHPKVQRFLKSIKPWSSKRARREDPETAIRVKRAHIHHGL
jgi:hypothetical protein